MRNADRPLTKAAATRYLMRLVSLHTGAVLLCAGFLLAAAGVPAAGVLAMAAGFLLWVVSIAWASIEAVRMRDRGDRWTGPQSTAADSSRLTGWWYLDEATQLVGWAPGKIRRWLRASVIVCIGALVAVPVVAALA